MKNGKACFSSAKQKTLRAAKHIGELHNEIDKFTDTYPYVLKAMPTDNYRNFRLQIKPPQNFTFEISTLVGDVIHNLRSALDHLMWDLMEIDNGMQDFRLQFITRDNKEKYEQDIESKIQTPRADTIEFLKKLEAFSGGANDNLWKLNKFDIIDKHRAILHTPAKGNITVVKLTNPDGTLDGIILEGTKILFDRSVNLNDSSFKSEGLYSREVYSKPVIVLNEEIFKKESLIDTLILLNNSVVETWREFDSFIQNRT